MWTEIETTVGPLRLVANKGSLTAVDFLGDLPDGPGESASTRLHRNRAGRPGVRTDGSPMGDRENEDTLLEDAGRQLAAYFAGELEDFDLPLAPHGSDFQHRVWDQLRKIPYGETTSYGAIATRLGMTGHAARAVGMANARNPIPIIVPCHRVVGAGGGLTGYGGGMARKQLLLELERRAAPQPSMF